MAHLEQSARYELQHLIAWYTVEQHIMPTSTMLFHSDETFTAFQMPPWQLLIEVIAGIRVGISGKVPHNEWA